MKPPLRLLCLHVMPALLGSLSAHGQNLLPAPLSFALIGQFQGAVSENTNNSLLYTDNNLTTAT